MVACKATFKEMNLMLNKRVLHEIQEYIESHLNLPMMGISEEPLLREQVLQSDMIAVDLEDFIKAHRKPTLNRLLFHFIDQAGVSDTEVYKKAGIDRKLFSKIRSNPDYRPGKNTTIALALALKLDKEDTNTLLSSVGYSLSDSDTFDLIIQYCIENNMYELYAVNEALYYFNQKIL